MEIETGEKRRVTSDGHAKRNPAISADYLAWIDHRRQIEIAVEGSSPFSDDIFVLDLAMGEQRRITEDPARRVGLRISGHRLVWMDKRNEMDGHYASYDIYGYDLEADEEIPIAVGPGAQRGAIIDGDTVVWSDNRNSPVVTAPSPDLPDQGCAECPENRFDIYAYDFTTGEERVLVSNGYKNTASSFEGELLGWLAFHPEQPRALKVLNVDTGKEHTVAEDVGTYYGPAVSQGRVGWVSDFSCDVGPAPHRDTTGAWVRSLATGETWRVSNYVEPVVALHGNVAFVFERCSARSRFYAVFLE